MRSSHSRQFSPRPSAWLQYLALTADSSFLSMSRREAVVMAPITGCLSLTGEVWIEFLLESFGSTQCRPSRAYGECTWKWEFFLSLSNNFGDLSNFVSATHVRPKLNSSFLALVLVQLKPSRHLCS